MLAISSANPDDAPTTSVVPATDSHLILAFDGGARSSTKSSAYACCVWTASGNRLWWFAGAATDGATNNTMEATGLLVGLRWIHYHHRVSPLRIIGDSAIVIGMATGSYRVHAQHLRPILGETRQLLAALRYAELLAANRVYNSATDGLCNWAMDQLEGADSITASSDTNPWPLLELISSDPIRNGCPFTPMTTLQEYDYIQWQRRWSMVLMDFERVAHIIRNRFLQYHDHTSTCQKPCVHPVPASVNTAAREESSVFSTAVDRTCTINGIQRCVPLGVFRRFQALAVGNHISFPVNRVFVLPTTDQFSIPAVDVRLLTAILKLPNMGIEGTLRLFRGQTSRDQRPNKALRPHLYRLHLASYPDLELLCSIAEHGLIPHWLSSPDRIGARPLPQNYPSALSGSAVLTHRLLQDYYRGRCILAGVTELTAEPAFHSSAFALVPKKNIPITEDGRTIHNLSAPAGASVNEDTDTEWTPDARWDPYASIAQRVLELRRKYPGRAIYALGADIADAFHHVSVHAGQASAFGGTLPRSQTGIVSGMAVFGWTASPGYFAVFGKAVRHYQRTGSSYVDGYPEPFWIFQWVDDIVLIEVDIGDRLLQAERRLRDAVKLVFGSDGWHEGKFTTWSQQFHAVGIDWSIPNMSVTIPDQKIQKTKEVIAETLSLRFVTHKRLESLVGRPRHIVTFIPVAKPFMQRLVSAQLSSKQCGRSGTPMTDLLRRDLVWWNQLVFEGVFVGVPMTMFDNEPPESDAWVISARNNIIELHGLTPLRSTCIPTKVYNETELARAILTTIAMWEPRRPVDHRWRHIRLHVRSSWEVQLLKTMSSRNTECQQLLREIALIQAARKLKLTVSRVFGGTAETRPCELHFTTHLCYHRCEQTNSNASWQPQGNSGEQPSASLRYKHTRRNSNTGSPSARTSDSLFGSINYRKRDRHGSLVSLRDYALSRVITPVDEETSIRPLTERWRRSPSRTRAFGTQGSITRVRNLSSLLRAIKEPTVKSSGRNQLPLPCCARCTQQWRNEGSRIRRVAQT